MTDSNAKTGVLADVAGDLRESLGKELLSAVYEEITNLRTPWVITPQQQQQELIDRLRTRVENLVAYAVTRIGTGGFPFVSATIDSLTIKDEGKAVLMLNREPSTMHPVADGVGSRCVLVFADKEAYIAGMDHIKAMLDQNELPLNPA